MSYIYQTFLQMFLVDCGIGSTDWIDLSNPHLNAEVH